MVQFTGRVSMSKQQWGRNEMIAAWRTVTPNYSPDCISLTVEHSTPLWSNNSFVTVSSTQFTDEFDAAKTITLLDEEIITLAQSVKVTFPGLSQFSAAFDLITRTPNESDIDFAKRKLSALRAPFIQDNSAHPLNDWHLVNRIESSALDEALADTAYFFDETNNRLIIRHTPINAVTQENLTAATKLVCAVRQIISASLQLPDDLPIFIEHIIPSIRPGRLAPFFSETSDHIVLRLNQEVYTPSENKADNELIITFDPRTNFSDYFYWNPPNYHSIDAQEILNVTDCGRHVTVMATVAARILAEFGEKSAVSLTKEDFKQFPQIVDAKNCSVSDVKKLLGSITTASFTPVAYKKNEGALKKAVAALSEFSFFTVQKPNGNSHTVTLQKVPGP